MAFPFQREGENAEGAESDEVPLRNKWSSFGE